jgi:hypothetical protein
MIELTDGSKVTAAQFKAQNKNVQYAGEFPSTGYLESIGAAIVNVEVPAPIPRVVTMRQARLALLQQGLLANIQPAIDALDEPHRSGANIEWEYSQTVERTRPFVLTLGEALGLTDDDLDALFELAATL